MSDPEDIARFTALYDAHHPRVHAYAVSRVGVQAAEEITSETFCVAWRRVRDLPAEPLPWLLGIARNLLRESYRVRDRQDALARELRTWAAGQPPAGDVGEAVAERAGMLRALAALPDGDRELLALVAWHGLSPGEAAKVIGCSKASFYVRLHRARRRLERALTGESRAPDHGAPAPRPSLVSPERKVVR
ncbi:ECF RNA polymerase sigma factor EcfG [Actinomadura sp. RB99]|uniref:RNA polymerase sigma factor n=1 Tax=Actinomadura sp. RB99 TaxID=2691577 RepID=UPI00188E00C1|nr:sigma-70 family RNA polymerase sigma factor [Actinomadura sp. RB99]MBD2891225.1 ECF RNA polymerase sigma factor EcfG [Actinomadura sp. RB99]